MNLTPRQIQIKEQLYDLLQTLRFTRPRDQEIADERITEVVKTVDQIVDGELSKTGIKLKAEK